jgi:hypothetical protein
LGGRTKIKWQTQNTGKNEENSEMRAIGKGEMESGEEKEANLGVTGSTAYGDRCVCRMDREREEENENSLYANSRG